MRERACDVKIRFGEVTRSKTRKKFILGNLKSCQNQPNRIQSWRKDSRLQANVFVG